MVDKLYESIVDMNEQGALLAVTEFLSGGGDPIKVLEVSKNAMDTIGEKFEKREYFLSELIHGAEIFKRIMEITLPKIKQDAVQKTGTIVLGTVKDDVHDIGKNIFKVFAEASGFEVIDIGIDTPEEKFVEAVKSYNPDIVGMSCLITAGVGSMKRTVEALANAGVRDRVKIVIGGGRADEGVKEFTGADAWADDAAKGVRICKELIGMER